MRDMLSCAVRFLGRALDSVYNWGISSKNEGVGTGYRDLEFLFRGSVVIIEEAGDV